MANKQRQTMAQLVAETHATVDSEFRDRFPLAAALVRIRMAGLEAVEMADISALPAGWQAEAELRRVRCRRPTGEKVTLNDLIMEGVLAAGELGTGDPE